MTLTAIIGALVALLPRPERPVPIPVESEVERLTKENARLQRSQARLVDHIERLEREILLEQHLTTHWREAAQRLAKQSRENRERFERERPSPGEIAQYLAQMQRTQAQQQLAYAQQNAMQAQQAQLAAYAGAQVWHANRGEE